MNKERLEELLDDLSYIALHSGKLEPLKQFAREQADRVRKLEKDIKEWEIVNESWEEINTDLAEQNKRYREALEGIVHQENLKETNVFGYDHEDISSYVEEVARQALKGESE